MRMNTLNPRALGASGAILSAAGMLLLGVLGNFGMYTGAVQMMMAWHLFFSLSVLGIIAGMVEAALLSFIALWAFAYIYNALLSRTARPTD